MSDPFRERSNAQLYREAQLGLGVIAILLVVFVYLAIDRFSEDEFPMPVVVRSPSSPVNTDDAAPESPPITDSNPHNMVATPVNVDETPYVVQAQHVQPVSTTDRNQNQLHQNKVLDAEPGFGPIPRDNTANDLSSQSVDRKSTDVIRFQSPDLAPDSSPSPEHAHGTVDRETALKRQQQVAQMAAELQSTIENFENQHEELASQLPKTTVTTLNQQQVESPEISDLANSEKALSADESNAFEDANVVTNSSENEFPNVIEKPELPSMTPPRPLPTEFANSLPTPLQFDSAKSERSLRVPNTPGSLTPNVETLSNPEISEAEKELAKTVLNSANRTIVTATTKDSFYTLAQEHYGDGRYFRALCRYNEELGLTSEEIAANDQVRIPSTKTLRHQYSELCPIADSDAVLRNGRSGARAASERIYVTREGDSLFGIARQQTGQASRYNELIELNRQYLDTTDHLERLPAGIRLVLPVVKP